MYIKRKFRGITIFTLFIFSCFTLTLDYSYSQEENPLLKAQGLYKQGNFMGAVKILEAFIEKNKGNQAEMKNIAKAYYLIARMNYDISDDTQMVENLRLAIEANIDIGKEETNLDYKLRVDQVREEGHKDLAVVKQKQEDQARESSRYVSSASVNLRSYYRTVSDDDAKAMAKRLGIFMSDWNPSASGISHQYQSRTISGDRVVIDGATGLIWHQSGSDSYLTFEKAKQWLDDLNRSGYAGYSDWRLPTLEEGTSLLESSKRNGDLYIDPVFSNTQKYIWTGDSYSYAASWVWVVGFNYGSVNRTIRAYDLYVRPVRSGK